MIILKKLYKPGYQYKRAGVFLSELSKSEYHQGDLLTSSASKTLDNVLDEINQRYGRGTAAYGRLLGQQTNWKMNQNHLSPSYTSDWQQLMRVG